MLENGQLDYVAITDHGTVNAAQKIKSDLGKLGRHIIIGEEIKTTDGELIGLFLNKTVPEGLSPTETIQHIHSQDGLAYVPHPFETVRSGISEKGLEEIISNVDIIEVCNGRAVFQNRGVHAGQWAEKHSIAMAASSDAHGRFGWGRTYSIITAVPTQEKLGLLLKDASYSHKTVALGILYPKLNRIRKKYFHAA